MSRSMIASRAGLLCLLILGSPCLSRAQPDPSQSYFVPEAGPVAAPLTGEDAIRFFRVCPNNDGNSSLPMNARIKIVLRNSVGDAVANHPAAEIYILFNGGTVAQGFTGDGADSIIANSTFNTTCPDVTRLYADGPTDNYGVTYITFGGADPGHPGVGMRDASRKWGHYDSDTPVFVVTGGSPAKLSGWLNEGGSDAYSLKIKNFDVSLAEGFSTTPGNRGERVNTFDYNLLIARLGLSGSLFDYWLDFDNDGTIGFTDFNMMVYHLNHNCTNPLP